MKLYLPLLIIVFNIILPISTAFASVGSWSSGNLNGGNALSISVYKQNSSIIYIGSYNGGVFKSSNGGNSWTYAGLSGNIVNDIKVDSNNPMIVYAGVEFYGMFKSTNGGGAWSQINNGIPASSNTNFINITRLVIDPIDSSILYAATTNGGFYKTINGGLNWLSARNGADFFKTETMSVDPNNPLILYQATETLTFNRSNVYKSIDGAKNWTLTSLQNIEKVSNIIIDPSNSLVIYAGRYKSINGGITWNQMSDLEGSLRGILGIDLLNTSTIYAETRFGPTIKKSVNGGMTWAGVSNGLPINLSIAAIALDPTNSSVIYSSIKDYGIYKTTNTGENWFPINNGFNNVSIQFVACSPTNPSLVYAAASAGNNKAGLFRSNDGGVNWTETNPPRTSLGAGGVVYSIKFAPNSSSLVYFGTNDGVYKTTDGGVSFTALNNGLQTINNSSSINIIQSIIINPNNPLILYAGAGSSNLDPGGVFKSIDGGASWTRMNNGLTDTLVYSMAIDPQTPSTIYAGTDRGRIFKSIDGAASWIQIGYSGGPNIRSITVDPTNSSIIYVGAVEGSGLGGAYKSINGGNSFSNISPDTNNKSFDVAVNPSNPSVIYASGGTHGLYKSENAGLSWQVFNNGLISFATGNISIDNSGNHLFIGSKGNGVFNYSYINLTKNTFFDYTGDGNADISVFRPSSGTWYLQNSQTGYSSIQFGQASDRIAPADYDGDGKTDVAVYRSGTWFVQRSQLGFTSIQFGAPNDIPVPADYDADGKADLAVYRSSNGTWYVLNATTGQYNSQQWGNSTDKPVVADYDGDSKADYAVYRPSNGTWYLLRSRDGFASVQWGELTDKPVVGDYDGDGKADQAIYRLSNGTWYLLRSRDGFSSAQWGESTDLPTPADYDGDGKTDISIFRPSSGTWYQMRSMTGFFSQQFGTSEDLPAPNSFVR